MNSEDKNYRAKLLMKYLDGDASSEEEKEALHMIAEDESMREMLRFDRVLTRSFGKLPSASTSHVPRDFADLVMESIENINLPNASTEQENENIWDRMMNPLRSLLNSGMPYFRPALGYAFVLIAAALSGYYVGMQTPDAQLATTTADSEIQLTSENNYENSVWIRFIYIDDTAEEMAVAGDFSDWEPIPLDRQTVEGQKVWSGLIEITRGEHKYMFLKNGETWLTDPLADITRDDGFGNKNAVLIL